MEKDRLDRFTFEEDDIEIVTYKELQEGYRELKKEIEEKKVKKDDRGSQK